MYMYCRNRLRSFASVPAANRRPRSTHDPTVRSAKPYGTYLPPLATSVAFRSAFGRWRSGIGYASGSLPDGGCSAARANVRYSSFTLGACFLFALSRSGR